ncbi:Fic family protein [[Mycobacterium] burgundiense]|uniref:Fic family protein n=1 Tax=[Mycobacterium] burgundiense TaxID=3064286 RepID=A0ABM9L8V1_9MYCO|nr:Fic family protein [Mycolicibacterium sp. MU0053]CAJ1494864.1 Fic family protein [Mycolicibacterium sp. MU0053]
MKKPMPPPTDESILRVVGGHRLMKVMFEEVNVSTDPYLPWDELRYRKPPEGVTTEEWWLATRMARNSIKRALPLRMLDSEGNFSYALPDEVLRLLDEVTQRASGQIAVPEQVTNAATKDRYVINSLIEEAITSSQLEGASTSRKRAKEMIRHDRKPTTRSEQMIMNNYLAMQHVSANRNVDFTPGAICQLHEIVTYNTLDAPESAGKIQTNPDPDDRVKVFDGEGNVLHTPPPVGELPARLQELCDFANGKDGQGVYVPPVVRALAIHFMVGYDHYFEDGNGRTARALFYWSMLKQGYWLSEFLTISRILKQAPAKYTRSFIFTEQDRGDMTYFLIYQLKVIQRALNDLDKYLARKSEELQSTRKLLSPTAGNFNYRQVSLLEFAIKHPGEYYTVKSHAKSHGVSEQAARNDLYELQDRMLLERDKIGREFVWTAPVDLTDRIKAAES